MKRTQVKDALRNIWKQRVSWFAIVVIAMLSVTAYLGINFAARGIAQNANDFYDATSFRDAEIISTLLLTQDDLHAIRAVEGVADAEGVYQTEGKIENAGLRESVDVVSLTERINLPRLLEGRLPEKDGECAVEQPVVEALGLSVGDTIRITDAQGDTAKFLLTDEFVITGVIHHPDHAALPGVVPGNRDVVVLPETFDREELDDCCMKAVVRFALNGEHDRFEEEYLAASAAVMARLEAISAERAALRSEEVRTGYQEELDEGRAELAERRAELDEARAELDEGWDALADGEQELADGEAQLADGRRQLDEAWQQLEDAKAQLEDAEAQLAAAKAELDSGEAELAAAEAQLAAARAELVDGWNELEDAKETIRSVLRSGVESVLGSEIAAMIPWASRQDVDLSGSGASATEFYITDSVSYDLSLSTQDYIEKILASSRIPDDLLIRAYEKLIGGGEQ